MPATSTSILPDTSALASELRLAVTRLTRRLRRERRDYAMTPSQISALISLDMKGPLSPSALAECERVQPPSMTRIIGSLEERGLLSREPHPTDRRQFVLDLTPAGREMAADERASKEAWLVTQLEMLSDEERQAIAAALDIIERLAGS